MAAAAFDRQWWFRLLELVLVTALWLFGPKAVVWTAAQFGTPLPEMPLLRHAYLYVVVAVLLLVWVMARRESLADFGLVAPRRWLILIGRGLILLVATILVDTLIVPLVNPFVEHLTGGKPDIAVQHFASVKGNLGLFLYLVPFAWAFGGFGEEFVSRGFILTRIAQLLGGSRVAWAAAVVLQAVPFALGHVYQGPVGMVDVFLVALVPGIGAVVWGRNLWPCIFAHGAFDSLQFLALYLGAVHG